MLAFGPDNFLYIGVGDGGSGNDPFNNAQDLGELLGKVLRIDVNAGGGVPYASPPTNPFVTMANARGEIFAYGLRNPWRFSFDRFTGQLWLADVGQGSREEVNMPVVSAGNYGWRVYEGTACTGVEPFSATRRTSSCRFSTTRMSVAAVRLPADTSIVDPRPRSRGHLRLRRFLFGRDLLVERIVSDPGARHDDEHLVVRRGRNRRDLRREPQRIRQSDRVHVAAAVLVFDFAHEPDRRRRWRQRRRRGERRVGLLLDRSRERTLDPHHSGRQREWQRQTSATLLMRTRQRRRARAP